MKAWSIVVFVGAVVLFGFYTRPLISETKLLSMENDRLESQIVSLNTQLQEINRIQKENADKKEQLIKQIPLHNEQENLIRDIQNITARSGFSFDALSFTKGHNPVLSLPEIKISFTTKGNKQNLIRFLELIEQNERFLGLENIDINTRQEGSAQVVTFGVSLYAFYQQ